MQGRSTLTLVVIGLGSVGCADAAVNERSNETLAPLRAEGPTRSVASPIWPRTNPSQEALQTLSEASREAVRQSPVPVLVPAGQTALGRAKVMAGAHWYASSSHADGLTVNVSATDVVHRVRGVEPATGKDKLRQDLGFVTQNEGIWSATFEENQTSYAVTVECARHDDSRCESGAFIQALVNDLVYVGGKGAEVSR